MPELSVVVLCYHSGKTILPFFDQLKNILDDLKIDYEIILVANDFAHSKDETIKIVKELAKNNDKVIPVTKIKEGMMGWDMQQGINACTGNYICVIDGDGQFPIGSVAEVYKHIKKNSYDLVKTHRIKRQDGLYRYLISNIYNFIFNLLFPGLHAKDVNSKPKIFTHEVYTKMNLKSTDWFIDAEIMIEARRMKLRLDELPIEFAQNESRKSFVRINAILEFCMNIIKYRFKKQK